MDGLDIIIYFVLMAVGGWATGSIIRNTRSRKDGQ
jgi:hypothetical protein